MDKNLSAVGKKTFLKAEDIYDQAVFENTWLPVGDRKETDILNLIKQIRID